MALMSDRNMEKAALRGEPSYVWRAGQQRRLEMILCAAGDRVRGSVLENGCGVGMYVEHLAKSGGRVFGLEYDFTAATYGTIQKTGLTTNPYSVTNHRVLASVCYYF